MQYRGKRQFDAIYLKDLAKECKSKHDMLGKLSLPTTGSYGYRTLNYFIDLYEIDISHFGGREIGGLSNAILLDDILAGKHPSYGSAKLRERLIKGGLLANKCHECGIIEWRGKPAPLELDHINGKSWDHNLENLRILCRNCHGLTDTFCGRNIAKNTKEDAPPSSYRVELAQRYADRERLLRNSEIDFGQYGWVSEAAVLLDMRPQKVSSWMRQHMPAFYDACYRRKS